MKKLNKLRKTNKESVMPLMRVQIYIAKFIFTCSLIKSRSAMNLAQRADDKCMHGVLGVIISEACGFDLSNEPLQYACKFISHSSFSPDSSSKVNQL